MLQASSSVLFFFLLSLNNTDVIQLRRKEKDGKLDLAIFFSSFASDICPLWIDFGVDKRINDTFSFKTSAIID